MDFPIRETIEKRRSVRTYETRPLSREDRERLTSYAARIENPFGVPVRIGLIETERSEQPKKLGTYGVIKGAGTRVGYFFTNIGRAVKRKRVLSKRKKAEEERRRRQIERRRQERAAMERRRAGYGSRYRTNNDNRKQ